MYASLSTQQPAAICALRSPADAIHILEAVRVGLVPRVTRRLTGQERGLIRPGTVWVWEEEETNMRRWTDGRRWGASRVGGGGFLVYTESSESASPPRGASPRSLSLEYHFASGSRQPEPLVKQTYSTSIIHRSTGKVQKFHVVAYSSKRNPQGDAHKPLPLPHQLPLLSNLKVIPGIWPEWEQRRDSDPSGLASTSNGTVNNSRSPRGKLHASMGAGYSANSFPPYQGTGDVSPNNTMSPHALAYPYPPPRSSLDESAWPTVPFSTAHQMNGRERPASQHGYAGSPITASDRYHPYRSRSSSYVGAQPYGNVSPTSFSSESAYGQRGPPSGNSLSYPAQDSTAPIPFPPHGTAPYSYGFTSADSTGPYAHRDPYRNDVYPLAERPDIRSPLQLQSQFGTTTAVLPSPSQLSGSTYPAMPYPPDIKYEMNSPPTTYPRQAPAPPWGLSPATPISPLSPSSPKAHATIGNSNGLPSASTTANASTIGIGIGVGIGNTNYPGPSTAAAALAGRPLSLPLPQPAHLYSGPSPVSGSNRSMPISPHSRTDSGLGIGISAVLSASDSSPVSAGAGPGAGGLTLPPLRMAIDDEKVTRRLSSSSSNAGKPAIGSFISLASVAQPTVSATSISALMDQ